MVVDLEVVGIRVSSKSMFSSYVDGPGHVENEEYWTKHRSLWHAVENEDGF